MQFSTLAVVAFLAGVGLAAPAVEGLSKRARESIHLADCVTYKVADYYPDDSQDDNFPATNNECVLSGGFREGQTSSCTFGSGVTFTYTLDGGALDAPNAQLIGTGTNGFHSWNCFRDDNHVLYTDGNGHQCKTIYVLNLETEWQ
ncbi:hypothetical protein F5Y05DRAFT_415996 [Hypoxylon sp. FL0543]|nr:hypothetical protein F5Y05DRAFT_415996 [Hypoxylon sp. FL0543]